MPLEAGLGIVASRLPLFISATPGKIDSTKMSVVSIIFTCNTFSTPTPSIERGFQPPQYLCTKFYCLLLNVVSQPHRISVQSCIADFWMGYPGPTGFLYKVVLLTFEWDIPQDLCTKFWNRVSYTYSVYVKSFVVYFVMGYLTPTVFE